jgi:SpoVK/Ycf46/Vps4 family AAA+-type ATPase
VTTPTPTPPIQRSLFVDVPPGHLKFARPFWPALPGWARNLLVTTDLATRRNDEGTLVAAGLKLCMHVVDEGIESKDGLEPEQRVQRFVTRCGERLDPPCRTANPFRRNLRIIGRIAGLRRVERRVLEFLVAVRSVKVLEELTDCFPNLSLEHVARLLALALAEPLEEVRRALRPDGRLVASGLVSIQPWPDFVERKILVSNVLPDLLMATELRREDVLDAFAPGAPAPSSSWDAISRRVPNAALLRGLLAGAAGERRRGVNVLLHGPPGSGKSELARAVVRDLGLDLREIQTRTAAHQPGVEPRVAMLVSCDQLVRDGGSVLLFDAIEDALQPKGPPAPGHLGAAMSVAWLERRLEQNAVSTLWTTTDPNLLDPVLLGRFSLLLEVPALDERARGALLGMKGPIAEDLRDAELARLAATYAASPAELARAVETASLAGNGTAAVDAIEAILAASLRARGGARANDRARPKAYRADCIHASADVESIARSLSGWTPARGGVALLLHGLPGTGKSEWVQELGRRLHRPVIERRSSQIESKWLGESQQNLARAFREAAERGAVLLFDEVDSFLRDRRGATFRWEVELTNEFLQQLETHPGIVACTTNLLDSLDPAVLRRFPIKVEFRPSTPEQAAALFEAYFEPLLGADPIARVRPELPRLLAAIGALTPGDFGAIERRVRVTGEVRTVDDVLRLLGEEIGHRAKGGHRAVGFQAQPPAARNESPRLVEAATFVREPSER